MTSPLPAAPPRAPPVDRASWVGAVVIDCSDLPRMTAFWQAALGYVPREPHDATGGVLTDPHGVGPNVALNLSTEPPLAEYRTHLDLYASDPDAEVERLIALGARRVRAPTPGSDFTTLADPDGNLFDVIDKRGWAFGRRA